MNIKTHTVISNFVHKMNLLLAQSVGKILEEQAVENMCTKMAFFFVAVIASLEHSVNSLRG